MYLKSIEVNGFKSFANKIKFEFHNGITCIVGPNGSGKSNVGDAVRWVLGEQSAKQLRGSSMQDVIFSGTENRKPQGFAYVAITLDNSDHTLSIDYEEVTVARRVYRSGESEYLLNGRSCRLKDVNELFYDTGIGKEGYSIIGQGQIDQILSSKPEDRRELFDEAAGIVKFKRRKTIALKKLEDERANMIRVYDILSELEKQVGPLEKQAEAAKEFLKWKEELKTYDIHAYLLEREKGMANLSELEEKIRIVGDDLEEVSGKSKKLKIQYESVEAKAERMEQELEAKRGVLNEQNVQMGKVQGQINVLHEQIRTERMNEAHLTERVETLKTEIREKSEARIRTETEKSEKQKRQKDCETEKQKTKQILDDFNKSIESCRRSVEDKQGKMLKLLNEKSSFMAKQQRAFAILEQNRIQKASLNKQLLRNKTEIETNQKITDDYKSEWERLTAEETTLQTLLKQLAAQLEEQKKQREKAAADFTKIQQEYQVLHTRAESLKNLAERYEGYGNSIKRIMEQKEKNSGIRGVVADIIKVEKQYETAVETALGGSIQNIVTDTEQTAKQLIEYLKKNKYGRATFLPLNGIRKNSSLTQKEILKETGIIGAASDLVSVEPEYKNLIEMLLGRVIVADQIDHALAAAGKYRYSVRIVTLEGELLNAGGSMTGGAYRNSSSLLGRKREIEELVSKSQRLSNEIEKQKGFQRKLISKQESGQKQLLEYQSSLQKIALQKNTVRISKEQTEQKSEEIQLQKVNLVKEINQLEKEIAETQKEHEELETSISSIEISNSESETFVTQHHKVLKEEEIKRDETSLKLENLNLENSKLEQSVLFLSENLSRLQFETARLTEEKDKSESGFGKNKEVIEQKEQTIVLMEQQVEQLETRKETLEEEIQKISGKREDIAQRQKSFFVQREEFTDRMSQLDRELFRLNEKREKQEEQLDAKTNYIWNEYELSPSEAAECRQEGFENYTQIKNQIGSLKSQIKALGNVNVNAIEDYKEVEERYTFMKKQYEDLFAAEAALVTVIKELDAGMRHQFEEKFKEIKAEFNNVFQELFGGGQGTVELTEGEDIIEAGIRIISQPPGKKLQNMMQLSGGEKALTAIALLFAIQSLKPSPFCLLDEIEAALDDSNVGRFSNYLHKLTKSTQFIIITHRRGTMASADRLYGITMQEKGVSTLVSVNLIEEGLT